MPLSRPHKGSLSDSMKEVVIIEDKQTLVNKAIQDLWEFNLDGTDITVQVKLYSSDYPIDFGTPLIL